MPYDTLAGSLDYDIRISDKTYYVSPTRGQQGNALKCIWAAPSTQDEKNGFIEASAHGDHADYRRQGVGNIDRGPAHAPDSFFTADQRQRLIELVERWRAAREAGGLLPAEEQAELEALVTAELEAATRRAAALLNKLQP